MIAARTAAAPRSGSRLRRDVEHQMVLAKADLNKVEEVAAEQVAGEGDAAEGDIEIELPEVRMRDLHRVQERIDTCTACREEGDTFPAQKIDAQSMGQRAVEERAVSAGVQVGSDLDRESRISWVEESEGQDGKWAALRAVAVWKLIRVRDGGHASQTHVGDILPSWLLDIEHVGDLDALPASGGDDTGYIAPVRDDPFPFETDPLARIAAQHIRVSAYPFHLAPSMLRNDRLVTLAGGCCLGCHDHVAPLYGTLRLPDAAVKRATAGSQRSAAPPGVLGEVTSSCDYSARCRVEIELRPRNPEDPRVRALLGARVSPEGPAFLPVPPAHEAFQSAPDSPAAPG